MIRMTSRTVGLAARSLSYADEGATRPDLATWTAPLGYRRYEKSVLLGVGDACWEAAGAAVLSWGVKLRSGFTVDPAVRAGDVVRVGQRYWLLAHLGWLLVREPAKVVAVVAESDRRDFAFGTLNGHPVSGEEAFIVHRDTQGVVSLTLRSLTWPGSGWWRLAFPAALFAQRWYRRRYLRALTTGG